METNYLPQDRVSFFTLVVTVGDLVKSLVENMSVTSAEVQTIVDSTILNAGWTREEYSAEMKAWLAG